MASGKGSDIDLGPPRQRALFAVLAAHADQAVSRAELIDAVWDANPPATVESSVYTYIARLRRRLEPERARRGRSDLLVYDGSGYSLRLSPSQVDSHVFEQRLERARQLVASNTLCAAVAELEAALALWRGTAFAGAPGPFADAERVRLGELRFMAMETRADILLKMGRHDEVIGELTDLVRRHPLRERLRYLRMVAYYRAGRSADALAEFRDVRDMLIRELGIEPGEHLQQCHQDILRNAVELKVPQAPVRRFATGAGARAVPAELPRNVSRFTGRQPELARLHEIVSEAEKAGEASVTLIDGAPGVGKTALAVRFGHELAGRFTDGQFYVDLRGFADAPQPMPSVEALSHLLSGLDDNTPPGLSVEQLAGRFRSIAAGRRLLIILDNARSAQQVRPLLPGSGSCVVVVTSRNRLSGLVARDGARRLTLGPMPAADAVTLMSRVLGHPDDGRLNLEDLARACCCLPIALRIAAERVVTSSAPTDEAIQDLTAGGHLLDGLDPDDDDPSAARTLFSWSYRTLGPDAAQMFRVLGLHGGGEFTLAAGAALINRTTGETRRLLNSLICANLLEEIVRNRFQMHSLLQDYARELALAGDSGPDWRLVTLRMLDFYRRSVNTAFRTLDSGDVAASCLSADDEVSFASTDEADRWLSTELPTLLAVMDRGRDAGLDDAVGELCTAVQDLMRLRVPVFAVDRPTSGFGMRSGS